MLSQITFPPQTAAIFQRLHGGHFLVANHPDPSERALYRNLLQQEAYYRELFRALGYALHLGPDFVFLSQPGAGDTALQQAVDQRPELRRMLARLELRGLSDEAGRVRSLLRRLERDGFLAQTAEEHYRVLSSFAYLERILEQVEIRES